MGVSKFKQMKKLKIKDLKRRNLLVNAEQERFVLRIIYENENFNMLLRWNAFTRLKHLLFLGNAISSISNRCLYSINKKKFNKNTTFSRHIFLKLIRTGQIYGVRKASW